MLLGNSCTFWAALFNGNLSNFWISDAKRKFIFVHSNRTSCAPCIECGRERYTRTAHQDACKMRKKKKWEKKFKHSYRQGDTRARRASLVSSMSSDNTCDKFVWLHAHSKRESHHSLCSIYLNNGSAINWRRETHTRSIDERTTIVPFNCLLTIEFWI